MPCCAFAACIVGQLILGIGVLKRALLGRSADGASLANPAVEWRLDSPARAEDAASSFAWHPSARGLALAVALEIVLVLGGIYGLVVHAGHGVSEHTAHSHHTEAASRTGR